MEQNLYPEQLNSARGKILAAFKEGRHLTSNTGNSIGHTVDFRKIVSILRDAGFNIKDYWAQNPNDKRRFKVYYLEPTQNPDA